MDGKTMTQEERHERDRQDALRYVYLVGYLAASRDGNKVLESLDDIASTFGGSPEAAQIAADIRASRERSEQRQDERKKVAA